MLGIVSWRVGKLRCLEAGKLVNRLRGCVLWVLRDSIVGDCGVSMFGFCGFFVIPLSS